MPEVHGSTHFQAIEIMNEPEAVLSEPAPNPPQHASPITIIQNRSSLISYEALGIEKDEFDKAIEQSKNLPQVLVWAGAYELFGVGVYKSSLIEVLGSIGQCWLRIGIVYAAQAYTYPPAQAGFVTGLVIAIYIYTFAMSSGAHFNSLITFTSMCTGHLPIVRGLLYIPSQVLGNYMYLMNRTVNETFILRWYTIRLVYWSRNDACGNGSIGGFKVWTWWLQSRNQNIFPGFRD